MSRFASILFMLFAFLFGTVGSVSGAYNYASPELHSGDFLLWESEASTQLPLELADPTREIGVWVYDEALGVPVYVRQNPWTYFDPWGLESSRQKMVTDSLNELPGPLRWMAQKFGVEKSLRGASKQMDAKVAQGKNPELNPVEQGKAMIPALKTDAAIIASVKGALVIGNALLGDGEYNPGGGSARDNSNNGGGANNAPEKPNLEDSKEYIYGPENDRKINEDGSTNENTWSTPDEYSTQEEATDKLDPFKPLEGRRPAVVPAGTPVKRGVTPGGEGPAGGSGGANETLTPGGLPPGSAGKWEPLPSAKD